MLALMGQHPGSGSGGGTNSSPGTISYCSVGETGDNLTSISQSSSTNGNASIIGSDSSPHLLSGVQNPNSTSAGSVCGLTSPYESRLITGSYSRLTGIYAPSPYSDQPNYMAAFGTSHSSLYQPLSHPYESIKDPNSSGWSALPQTTCYPYEPTLYNPYGDRYGGMDSAARRKNATRETTNTLKAWLYEHRKNPYPTKGEKIMLAIITKMTLTQVSTWFANARRRLKKENKMTWEPRNKNSEGADPDDKDSCNDSEDNSSSGGISDNMATSGCERSGATQLEGDPEISPMTNIKREPSLESDCEKQSNIIKGPTSIMGAKNASRENNSTTRLDPLPNGHQHHHHQPHHHHHQQQQQQQQPHPQPHHNQRGEHLNEAQLENGTNGLLLPHHIKQGSAEMSGSTNHESDAQHELHGQLDPSVSQNNLSQRPKIWSLAQTATSSSPPYRGTPGGSAPPPSEWHLNCLAQGSELTSPGANDYVHSRHQVRSECAPNFPPESQIHHHHHHHPNRRLPLNPSWSEESHCLSSTVSANKSALILNSMTSGGHMGSNYPLSQKVSEISSKVTNSFPSSITASSMSHLVQSANESFPGYPALHPIMEQSSNVVSGISSRLTTPSVAVESENPYFGVSSSVPSGESGLPSRSSNNTFLGKVFSDFVSSGTGTDLNQENSFGEEGSPTMSTTNSQEPVSKRPSSQGGFENQGSAFRSMLKR